MKFSKAPFGEAEGQQVDLFTLENDNGVTVKITNYGGIVTSIVAPDKNGKKAISSADLIRSMAISQMRTRQIRPTSAAL